MKTILLIEDNDSIMDNLTEFLTLEGYLILTARTGQTGIDIAREHRPDLIVCDMLMPEMDGNEVLRRLLTMAETAEIPFIFSTSMSEKIDRNEAMRLGADDYIVKPFDPETLLAMVKKCILTGSKRHHSVK
jgi:DNA-binding response OmpR family regulator